MMTRWICAVMMLTAAVSAAWGIEFDYSVWYGGGTSAKVSVTAEPNAMGDEAGLKFTAEPATKKETFACTSHTFKSPADMTDFKSIEFSVKADHAISIMVSLDCEGGSMVGTWLQDTAGSEFKKFTFDRASMKVNGKPDLSKVKALGIGFGTWGFDTTSEGFSVTVARLKVIDSQTAAPQK